MGGFRGGGTGRGGGRGLVLYMNFRFPVIPVDRSKLIQVYTVFDRGYRILKNNAHSLCLLGGIQSVYLYLQEMKTFCHYGTSLGNIVLKIIQRHIL